MNEDQLKLLLEYIQAAIEEHHIDKVCGQDSGHEWLVLNEIEKALKASL